MLLKQGEPGYDTFFSAFSPLFYGIRDVTDNNGACNTPGHRTFSPLFYGIRDVTNKVLDEGVPESSSFSPLFYGIRDVTL